MICNLLLRSTSILEKTKRKYIIHIYIFYNGKYIYTIDIKYKISYKTLG